MLAKRADGPKQPPEGPGPEPDKEPEGPAEESFVSEAEPEVPVIEETGDKEPEEPHPEEHEEPEIPTVDQLEKMTVVSLRTLARKLKITNMTPQEIRFAKKQELIHAITIFTGQER